MTMLDDRPGQLAAPRDITDRVTPTGGVDVGTVGRGRFRIHTAARRTAGLVGVIAVLVGFGIVAVTPDGTGLAQRFDSALSRLVHIETMRPTALTSQFGSPAVVVIASLAVVVVQWSRQRSFVRNVAPFTAATIAGLVAGATASLISRPGPGHLGDLSSAHVHSFPSVSSAMLAALACTLIVTSSRRRALALAAFVLIVALPGIVRLLSATTWPLDELGGAFVGWSVAHLLRPWPTTTSVRTPRHRRSRRALLWTALAIGITAVGSGTASFAAILTAPGHAAFDERAVEWLRANGLGPLVDRSESWWLWRHLPSPTAKLSHLPPPPVIARAVIATVGLPRRADLPPAIPAVLIPALPGEGEWTIAEANSSGTTEIATSALRPDPAHPSVVVAVAWINSSTTRIDLIAGTRQPGRGVGPSGGHVPAGAMSNVLAAFNSGYKMQDTPGGTLIEGRTTRTMIDGLATLAVRPDGTATVGEWGSDLTAAQGFVGLRQNLHLMVRNGAVIPGVSTNAGGRWGTVRNTLPTWRSGLGVTAAGDLVYVGGDHLTLGVLADALVRAGAVTGMELDIHKGMVSFNLFTHAPKLVGHKLLPTMPSSADRYLATDWRDFVLVTPRNSGSPST